MLRTGLSMRSLASHKDGEWSLALCLYQAQLRSWYLGTNARDDEADRQKLYRWIGRPSAGQIEERCRH